MKRPAALSEGQPPKRDNDHRAFHGGLPRLCTDAGQHLARRLVRQARLRPPSGDGGAAGEALYVRLAVGFSRTAELFRLDLPQLPVTMPGIKLAQPSWPGLSRPSTSCLLRREDVDARD